MRLSDLFDNFLLDLDGVVYVGDTLTSGAAQTLGALRRAGKGLIFITNDPRASASGYAEKLASMGIAAAPRDVITSAVATAIHIKENYPLDGKTAYVVGTSSLKREIAAAGFTLCDGQEARRADFVIVGGHTGFNYAEMKTATLALRSGAYFFATNRDPAFPTPEGVVPATGAILASIEVASSKRAVAVGKPEPLMFKIASNLLPAGGRVAVIGDRLDTDILGGIRAGFKTILVLSGSTTEADASNSDIKPDYILPDLRGLLQEI
ncbi:MAG: HAD-IIA family hydrolase [Deltaproteobacteria bacterium]